MWPRCSRSVNGRSSAWLVLYGRFAVVQTKLGALKALPCWCAAIDRAVDKVVAQVGNPVGNPMPLTFFIEVPPSAIPKGWNHLAQGCEQRATLGVLVI